MNRHSSRLVQPIISSLAFVFEEFANHGNRRAKLVRHSQVFADPSGKLTFNRFAGVPEILRHLQMIEMDLFELSMDVNYQLSKWRYSDFTCDLEI